MRATLTPRLRLEPMVAAHAGEMFEVLADPGIYRYLDDGPPASAAKLRELYRWQESRRSPDGTQHWLNWLLRLRGGPAIGYLQATVDPGLRAYVAYVLAPARWGHGYAYEGMQAVIDQLARDHPVPWLIAIVEAENRRSVSLLGRLGFAPASGAHGVRPPSPSERLYLRALAAQ